MTQFIFIASGVARHDDCRSQLPAVVERRPVPNEKRSPASLAMERYAEGDAHAFGEVYDALAPKLHGYLLRVSKNPAVAEDLIQQTFLRIHDARGRFTKGSDVEPWAFAIARRLFLDWQRRTKAIMLPPGEVDMDALPGAEPDAHAMLHGQELSERLRRALGGLAPQQREVFLLLREHGLTMAQAAEVLGTTVAAIKQRSFRAHERLRRVFDDEDTGPDDEMGEER